MNEPQAVPDGRRDVDLLFGRWRLHNRRLVDLLDRDCAEWVHFEAEGQAHPILGGLSNLDSSSAPAAPPTAGRWRRSRCITATSARFKQAFSYDGGRCWQPNWVIILTQSGEEDDHG
jgi:hypothetical protein